MTGNSGTKAGGPDAKIVTGNFYPKYETRNPIARRFMTGFLTAFDTLINEADATDILEIGCGEGHLATRIGHLRAAAGRPARIRGIDIGPDELDMAAERAAAEGLTIEFDCRSVYELTPPADRAELVVACEVLEHLGRPEQALDAIAGLAGAYALFSVPREPVWRIMNMARGKYLTRLGNTPGHLQHWSQAGFMRLLARRFEIVEMRAPLPWTMVLARPRQA